MKNNKLIALVCITVVAVLVSYAAISSRKPETQTKSLFFPELQEQLGNIAKIEIQDNQNSLSFSREENDWTVDNLDNYPALPQKIKSTVIGVSELRIVSPKTTDPQFYGQLGVEDPSAEGAQSLLLKLYGENDQMVADLIVGLPRKSKAAAYNPGLYVRRPNEAQSYLVEGLLQINTTITDWYETALFDITYVKISEVEVTHPDGDSYSVVKTDQDQSKFQLLPLPKEEKAVSEVILNRFGSLLNDFQSLSVQKQMDTSQEPSIKINIASFEGLNATIHAFQKDDLPYATFQFEFKKPEQDADDNTNSIDLQDNVDKLNAKLSGWLFQIPDFKYDVFKNKSADLLQKEKDPEA